MSRHAAWAVSGLLVAAWAVADDPARVALPEAAVALPDVPVALPDVPVRVRQSLANYFDTFKLGPETRTAVDAAGGWSDAKQNVCLRLLARLLSAPPAQAAEWAEFAGPVGEALTQPEAFRDRLVRVDGRAVFVAPVVLSPEQAELHDRKAFDLVRIVTADGTNVDVITDAAPRHWPRWSPVDFRTQAIGLASGRTDAPVPMPPKPELPAWPSPPMQMLLVAPKVAWFADTPLGRLGMDYGLFDTVVDGKKLQPADSDAFYAMLAAVGRGTQQGIEKEATKIDDVIPLIDPRQEWMQKHRGEPVRLAGIARRATRIAVDDPARRKQLGTDHYWELFVFLETPTIQVGDVIQDSFPVVCCVRRLPPEMPHGESMSEWVDLAAFAMKQYAYSLPGEAEGQHVRRETPLFIAKQLVWKPNPSTKAASTTLGWVFNALAGATVLALVVAGWAMLRKSGRRQREPLPDRIDLE